MLDRTLESVFSQYFILEVPPESDCFDDHSPVKTAYDPVCRFIELISIRRKQMPITFGLFVS